MKRLTAMATEGRVRRTIAGLSLLCGLAMLTLAIPRLSGADPSAPIAATKVVATGVLAAAPGEAWADPATIMGAKSCIRCHRSEYLSWLKTKHAATEATISTFEGNTADYAKALGIKAEDVAHNSVCASCHATAQADAQGKNHSISGVSCESCHGSAGGEEGWLNRHAVYGPNVTRIENETDEHRTARIDFCEDAGMVRAANVYAIAKNCYLCHSVTNEKLVNAGHKIGKHLELIGYSIGEVRHNFHEDQAVNAEHPSLWARMNDGKNAQRRRAKFVVGILVDLEVSLAALAKATDNDGDLVENYKERVVEIAEDFLSEIIDGLGDDAPEGLEDLADTIEDLEVEDADYSEDEARKAAAETAASVAAIAKNISKMLADGKELKFEGVDEFMEDIVEPKGEAYSRE